MHRHPDKLAAASTHDRGGGLGRRPNLFRTIGGSPMRQSLFLSGLLFSSALVAPAAFAQTPPPPSPPAPTQEQAEPAQQREQEIEVSVPGASPGADADVVVTGTRTPNIVRLTPQVVSILSAADIARTGEGDIAGALQRVTGLSVVGNGFVFVRGLILAKGGGAQLQDLLHQGQAGRAAALVPGQLMQGAQKLDVLGEAAVGGGVEGLPQQAGGLGPAAVEGLEAAVEVALGVAAGGEIGPQRRL